MTGTGLIPKDQEAAEQTPVRKRILGTALSASTGSS